MKKRLARLKPAEEKAWEHYFRDGLNNHYGDDRAGQFAWRQMQKDFPRLRKYDGAHA